MNKTISRYLSKNLLFSELIGQTPSNNLGIVVVIPCYDEPNVCMSVEAIVNCKRPQCDVEVIVSINAGINSPHTAKLNNQKSENDLGRLNAKLPSWIKVYPIINNELPAKKAGVGLGRKIGMDEAVRRYVSLDKEDGIIVCFDADSTCDPNYLCAIEAHLKKPNIESASIKYEHPIEGSEFAPEIYKSIVQYELHLRYFIRMQKMIQLPYAFHTVGSSMACTVLSYCAVGGMNQRKAGEDFYFIHKLVKYGKHSELNDTKVMPSPRISDRVPFGTGRAIGLMQEPAKSIYYTYHPHSFHDLKVLVDRLPEVYKNQRISIKLSDSLSQFLESINIEFELQRILQNTSDYQSFYKVFWHWFDAFVLMKYLHYAREIDHPDIPVLEAVNFVLSEKFNSPKDALIYYREIDVIS